MSENPSFPFYASDWLGSNRRAMMSLAQQAGYVNLLCRQWAEPDCTLPDDDEVLARWSELHEGWFNGGSRLVRLCFPKCAHKPGRIANPKLLAIKKEREEWRAKSRKGGKKSGRVRRAKAAQTNAYDDLEDGNQTRTKAGTKGEPPPQPNANSPLPSPLPSPSSSSRSSPSRDETRRDDQTETAEDWDAVRAEANRRVEKLGLKATRQQNRSLLLKASALVLSGRLPENWLADSIEATRAKLRSDKPPSKPWAFLHKCLANKAADLGVELKPMLARINVPIASSSRSSRCRPIESTGGWHGSQTSTANESRVRPS